MVEADDRRMKVLSALVAGVLVLASCGSGNSVVLTAADSGSEIQINSGDRFELRLDSNPSTGYRWEIATEAGPSTVELVTRTYEGPDSDLVGAAGTEVFVFEAIADAGVLRLEYVRSFDDPPVPERIVEYVVRVDGAPWPPDDSGIDPPTTGTASVPTSIAIPAIQVGDLFDGEGARDALVAGFVIWDVSGARLCEVLMESYPPQCGGASLVIANPDELDVELDEAQGVRWTQAPVELEVRFDGDRLILGSGQSVTPSENDQLLVDAFVAFTLNPGVETAGAVPFAERVALGLGPEIEETFEMTQLSDPSVWRIDRDEFRAWSGPFSVLDFVAEPLTITVGAHPRCAGPPEPPPSGFEGHRRLSIQPTGATSCLEWWTVDFFIDANGEIAAVTLDLFAP